MDDRLRLTERELSEIKLALFYEQNCKHGTAGHNRLMLLANFAKYYGFELSDDNLIVPESVSVKTDYEHDRG
jgi:hypothetical protein